MTDRLTQPLDPRTKPCDAMWKTSPSGDHEPHPRHCVCRGRERIPLHPEPVVEVELRPDGLWQWIADHGAGVADTTPEAFQAARLAWLGAKRLVQVEESGPFAWKVDFGIGRHGGFATGPTPEAAIEAAFAAKEKADAD